MKRERATKNRQTAQALLENGKSLAVSCRYGDLTGEQLWPGVTAKTGGNIEGPTSETPGQMSTHAPQKCEGGKKKFSRIHQTIPHLLEPINFPPAV